MFQKMIAEHDYLNFGDKLTDKSKVWDHYLLEARIRDKDMLSSWSSNMDALLTFVCDHAAVYSFCC